LLRIVEEKGKTERLSTGVNHPGWARPRNRFKKPLEDDWIILHSLIPEFKLFIPSLRKGKIGTIHHKLKTKYKKRKRKGV